MTPLESIFYMIWRGIAIGILISAPMGPVGILCIQRTLDKGRKAGFFTGIGAAISDLIYCLLTGFGLSFIEEFLNDNQNVIQLLGSVVLIAFSIYLFRKNPSSPMRRPVSQNVSARKNILGGFLFTFSNPLIIFLIIGLFARFNFSIPEISGGYYAIGYLFIIGGALTWWYAVTFVIEKVRHRFNMRSMKRLNIIIGIVILGFAFVGIITSIIGLTSNDAKAENNISLFENPLISDGKYSNHSDSIEIIPLYHNIDDNYGWQLDFKLDYSSHSAASLLKRSNSGISSGSRNLSPPSWQLILNPDSAESIVFSFRNIEYSLNSVESRAALEITPLLPDGHLFNPIIAYSNLSLPRGWNHFRLEYSGASGFRLSAGNRGLKTLCQFNLNISENNSANQSPDMTIGSSSEPFNPIVPTSISLGLSKKSTVDLRDISLKLIPSPSSVISHLSLNEIHQRIRQSNDPLEGYWRELDINLDQNFMKRGGDYSLAIIRLPDGNYEIVYLDGAITNFASWEPGMLKGVLNQSGIPGIYDMTWIDAMANKMTSDMKAQLDSSGILTLQFPHQQSSLRLIKVNK